MLEMLRKRAKEPVGAQHVCCDHHSALKLETQDRGPGHHGVLGARNRTPAERGRRAHRGTGSGRNAVKPPGGRTPGPKSGPRLQRCFHLSHGSARSALEDLRRSIFKRFWLECKTAQSLWKNPGSSSEGYTHSWHLPLQFTPKEMKTQPHKNLHNSLEKELVT